MCASSLNVQHFRFFHTSRANSHGRHPSLTSILTHTDTNNMHISNRNWPTPRWSWRKYWSVSKARIIKPNPTQFRFKYVPFSIYLKTFTDTHAPRLWRKNPHHHHHANIFDVRVYVPYASAALASARSLHRFSHFTLILCNARITFICNEQQTFYCTNTRYSLRSYRQSADTHTHTHTHTRRSCILYATRVDTFQLNNRLMQSIFFDAKCVRVYVVMPMPFYVCYLIWMQCARCVGCHIWNFSFSILNSHVASVVGFMCVCMFWWP